LKRERAVGFGKSGSQTGDLNERAGVRLGGDRVDDFAVKFKEFGTILLGEAKRSGCCENHEAESRRVLRGRPMAKQDGCSTIPPTYMALKSNKLQESFIVLTARLPSEKTDRRCNASSRGGGRNG